MISFLRKYRNWISIALFFLAVICYAFALKGKTIEYYDLASFFMEDGNYAEAIEYYKKLGDYKDSLTRIEEANNYIAYENADALFESGDYLQAVFAFKNLGDFQDSETRAIESQYEYAITSYKAGNYEEATLKFQELGNYRDSELYVAQIALTLHENRQETVYQEALRLFHEKEYFLALEDFNLLESYLDSVSYAQTCKDAIGRQELATTISAGIRYSVGVKADGTVISTGYNENGQSNLEEWSDIVSVSAKGIVTIGLKSDGTVVAAHQTSNINVDNWSSIVAVSAGERYVVGLRNDGTVISQGHDMGDGQRDVDDWTNIKAIATGWRHTVGLDGDGRVHITGYGDRQQLKQISAKPNDWENIVTIAAGGGSSHAPGSGHTVGLRADGTVVAVGDNDYGQCEVGSWNDIVAIAAGDWHTVGLRKDGTVVSTAPDPNKYPDLYRAACDVSDWKEIVEISAGCGTTIGKKANGSVVAVGYDDYNQSENATAWENIMVYKR